MEWDHHPLEVCVLALSSHTVLSRWCRPRPFHSDQPHFGLVPHRAVASRLVPQMAHELVTLEVGGQHPNHLILARLVLLPQVRLLPL